MGQGLHQKHFPLDFSSDCPISILTVNQLRAQCELSETKGSAHIQRCLLTEAEVLSVEGVPSMHRAMILIPRTSSKFTSHLSLFSTREDGVGEIGVKKKISKKK